jgi:acetate kinase
MVVNAGSSSLKLTLLDGEDATIAARELEAPRAQVDPEELHAALDSLGEPDAVGHRIVHGGERFREAVRIDAGVETAMRELIDLAPLHQRKSLAALDAVTRALPSLPAVACFDTAFHATIPVAAATYALPAEWRERWGLRRYGFHGLSHAWVARNTPELLERDASGLRIVSCHLGAGASLCAINDGISLDTTMGFTPLEGLVMATRSGSVDPGMLLWLLEHERLSATEMADALEHDAGLKGLAGSADMREVLWRADAGDESARLALDVYIHRLRRLRGSRSSESHSTTRATVRRTPTGRLVPLAPLLAHWSSPRARTSRSPGRSERFSQTSTRSVETRASKACRPLGRR